MTAGAKSMERTWTMSCSAGVSVARAPGANVATKGPATGTRSSKVDPYRGRSTCTAEMEEHCAWSGRLRIAASRTARSRPSAEPGRRTTCASPHSLANVSAHRAGSKLCASQHTTTEPRPSRAATGPKTEPIQHTAASSNPRSTAIPSASAQASAQPRAGSPDRAGMITTGRLDIAAQTRCASRIGRRSSTRYPHLDGR